MPSKNVVLNSFQRVEYVDRVTNRTALSTWRHHHKMLEGNFPVCPHHNKVDYVYGDGKVPCQL